MTNYSCVKKKQKCASFQNQTKLIFIDKIYRLLLLNGNHQWTILFPSISENEDGNESCDDL